MAGAGFRKRRYYFTDKSIASDTVIAYVLGGVALVIELLGIIFSIATKGSTPDIFATLYICAIILSVVGIIFAHLAKKAQEGGENSKRISMLLCVLALVIPVAIIVAGII
jgi:ABC-type transport system involved in cytochrome c biogenesis permease component